MDLKKKEMRLMHLSCNNDDAAGRGSARQTRLVDLAIPGRIPLGDPLPEWNLLCSRLRTRHAPAAVSVSAILPTDKTQCQAMALCFASRQAAPAAEASPQASGPHISAHALQVYIVAQIGRREHTAARLQYQAKPNW
jgi:hypothetical protein